MHSSLGSNICTVSHQHHGQDTGSSGTPENSLLLLPYSQTFSAPSPGQPLLCFLYPHCGFSRIPSTWNHSLYGLWRLASFVQQNAFEMHPSCHMDQQICPLSVSQCSMIRICHNFFIHPPTGRSLDCFLLVLAITNRAAINTCISFCVNLNFCFSRVIA